MQRLITMLVLLGWPVCASGFTAEAPANAGPSVIDDGQSELTVPSSVNAPFSHSLSQQSLAFTQNVGQWPDSILFRASAGGTVMWFTNDGIWYQFTKHIKKNATGEEALAAGLGPRRPDRPGKFGHEQDSLETALVKAQFVGANPQAAVVGLEEQAYRCNYFLGNDPAKWHADVPNYSAVSMRGIYPGVDATFRGNNGTLELVLSGPSEAVRKVTTTYRGAPASSQPDGSTVLSTRLGDKRFDGMLPATSEPVTLSAASPAGNLTLAYSTYLGGTSYDYGYAIALDGAGNAYVTGSTESTNFPTQTPFQTHQYNVDVFVTKLSADGTSLVYSTYLGGNNSDRGYGIAVDGAGNAYVTGYTSSSNFPTQNPYQTGASGWSDAFVTKLSADGTSLVYSTYLGGSDADYDPAIAVDGSGNAYVTGYTESTDFPTQSPYQTDQGTTDVFVTKLSADGSSLVYSTYLGGSDGDYGRGIAVDGAGNAYVTGYTYSSNFPTQTPYQTDQGIRDVFVTKLSASGSSLVYSTYLGGSNDDYGYGIAVDGAGKAYVTGFTGSTNFPTQSPYQTDQASGDVFVTKLSASGNSLVYSTYLGGIGDEGGSGIAVDGAGNAYITGFTESNNYPTRNPYQADLGFSRDAFVTKLLASGSSLVYSTYLGGDLSDYGSGIAVDGAGNAYVTGYTGSSNFPTQTPFQTDQSGVDVFVTKLGFTANCCIGVRGNVNMQDIVDVSDLSLLVAYLTTNPPPTLLCPEEANVNGLSIIDVSDLSMLVAYLTSDPPPTLPNCP